MKKLFLFASIILLVACSADFEQPIDDVKTVSEKNFKISEEEALLRLEKVLNAFEPTTRGKMRSVKEVLAYRSRQSRTRSSGVPDTLMFIMNFDDDNGYAVVSTDSRFPFLLALVDTGNYSNRSYPSPEFDPTLMDELDLDELDDFWCMQYYDSIPYITMIEDFLHQHPYQLTDTIISLDLQVGPYLTTRWNQFDPYNRLCDGSSDNIGALSFSNYPAGCVAVALAQILAYHRYPNSAYGHSYDWNKMNVRTLTPTMSNDTIYEVAHLIRASGIACRTHYKTDGSWSTANRARKALRDTFGYSGTDRKLKFADSDIISSLNTGTMALITALKGGSFTGHAWVIDGYRKYITNTVVYTYTDDTYTEVEDITNIGRSEQIYYHCNFGWGGTANGYYLGDIFNTIDGPTYTEVDEPYSTGDYNYKWWFRTVTYSNPN